MSFTDAEKVAIRRHMGYPVYGGDSTQAFGHRWLQHYGTLEYRMNHLTSDEEAVVRTHLTRLEQLETDIYGVRENLDTAAAAVWTRNPAEHAEREVLYRSFRLKLCHHFGLPPGPGLASGMNVRMVV